jgi:hypothetical protein
VLDIVVHQNIRVLDVIVSDILDSDHLPIIFNITLKLGTSRNSIEKITYSDRFQSIASELISPKIEIKSGQKPIKRRATVQPLLLRHIGCRQVKLLSQI